MIKSPVQPPPERLALGQVGRVRLDHTGTQTRTVHPHWTPATTAMTNQFA